LWLLLLQDQELFDLLARATINNVSHMSRHSLSDLVYSFAALQHPAAHAVLTAAAPAATACLDRFSFGMLSDLLWSYAAVGIRDQDLLRTAAAVLPQRTLSIANDTRNTAKVGQLTGRWGCVLMGCITVTAGPGVAATSWLMCTKYLPCWKSGLPGTASEHVCFMLLNEVLIHGTCWREEQSVLVLLRRHGPLARLVVLCTDASCCAASKLPGWGVLVVACVLQVLWALKKLSFRCDMEMQLAEAIPNIQELLGS